MAHQFKDSLQLSIQYIKYKQLSEDRQGTDNVWLKERIIIINLYNYITLACITFWRERHDHMARFLG